jgi:hypothetical protein
MINKKFEDLGIEYVLSIQGLNTSVYGPKREGLSAQYVKNFSELKHLGSVETASLKGINDGLIACEDSSKLCAILKKNRRFDKANAILNLNTNIPSYSPDRKEFVLQFYQIDFEKNK